MRIDIVIGGYLPGKHYGGPVTSIHNFTELFGDEFDIRIICNNHDLNDSTPYEDIDKGWNKIGKAKVIYLEDKELNYHRFVAIFSERKPDLIYASGIMYFKVNSQLVLAARKMSIPVLLAPRGDICNNALRIKQYKKLPFLWLLKVTHFYHGVYFHSTMEEESANLKKYLGISTDHIYMLPNIPTVPPEKKLKLKEKGQLRLLFISRIQSKKNLLQAIRIVNRVKSKVLFDIYGPIENKAYWGECQKEMLSAPDNVIISYKGELTPDEASRIYQDYECLLFPTLSENYGHVIAEALLNRCPVIISRYTTPWDDINEIGGGFAIDLDSIESFADRINQIAQYTQEEYDDLISQLEKYINIKFNFDNLKNEYINVINSITASL